MYIFTGVDLILRKLFFRDEDEKCSYLFNNIKINKHKHFYGHISENVTCLQKKSCLMYESFFHVCVFISKMQCNGIQLFVTIVTLQLNEVVSL